MFQNTDLLVISIGYPSGKSESSNFVKSQVNELKHYFKNISVIVPTPYFPKSLSNVKFFSSKYRGLSLSENYSYDNVHVFFPRFYTLPFKCFRNNFNGNLAYRATMRIIKNKKIEFDFIHSHFSWFSGYVAHLISRKMRKKYFLTIHESKDWFMQEYESNNKKIYNTWEKAACLIRVNSMDLGLLKKINQNSLFIPNGFDNIFINTLSKEECRTKLGLLTDKKVILNVANLKIKQKNQINLLDSLKLLREIRQDFVCYLIGSPLGGDEEKIRQHIKENNLDEYVFFVGEVKHTDVPIWMKASDLFYFPSYFESFGIVNIEALISGTPVVSTINGGSEEIIISEDYGFLCDDPEDVNQLKQKVDNALNKTWDTTALVQYAKEFEMKNIICQLIDMYRKYQ